MTSVASDGTEDDVCVGYPEHRGVRETYRGDDGIAWECTVCDAEGWEDAVTSDGTEDDYANLAEGASPNWTIMDELAERRVTFIGQPGAGKSELAGCCGERCDGTEEDLVTEGELPGFVGMLHAGRSDLARRAKAIVRGEDREAAVEEALRRLEEGPTMPSFSPFERDEALKRIVAEDADLLRRLAPNDGPVGRSFSDGLEM
jgi:hypothetical protein